MLALKEAGLQMPVLTNRKCIRGKKEWVSSHIITKPLTNKFLPVDAPAIGRRKMLLPGEALTSVVWLIVRESADAIVPFKTRAA